MQYIDRTEKISEGQLVTVPKGVSHCPKTENNEEVWVMLFEKQKTKHTGETLSDRTKSAYSEI